VRKIDRSGIPQIWIFLHSGLFINGLQGSHFAQSLIKINLSFSGRQAHNNLINGSTPTQSMNRSITNSQRFNPLKSSSIIEMNITILIINLFTN